MWLILTEPFDPAGPWLSDGLTARTGRLFSLFTSHDIGRDARYEHGGAEERAWFRLHTRNGAVIDTRTVRGVVNCLFSMPPGLSARMHPSDRSAAVRNFSAPLMRWLHRYAGPVINRPNAQGICGDIRMPAEWAAVAEASGLPCLPGESQWASFSWLAPQGSHELVPTLHRVVVIGDAVLSLSSPGATIPSPVARACLRLAQAVHAPVLGIDLAPLERETWCFVGAQRRPDLKPGGVPVIDAIARALGIGPPDPLQPPRAQRDAGAAPAGRTSSGAGDLISSFAHLFGLAGPRPHAR